MAVSVPTAAIVAIGDELLLGDTVDTNSAWLGQRLADLGIPVGRRWVVADATTDIQEAVSAAASFADVVLVMGGLGPTPDDRTREAVADLLGVPLGVDPDLLKNLEARFRERGHEALPERNVTQAQVLAGALILHNSLGTAPGQAIDIEGTLTVLLPGVPQELVRLVDEQVVSLLSKRFRGRLHGLRHRRIFTTGIAESVLAEAVQRALPADTGPVGLAYLPGLGGVELRLTVSGVDGVEAETWLGRIESSLESAVRGHRYRAEHGDLAEALADALLRSSHTLAVAESCTGGLLAKRITDLPGSSRFFVGGVVAYDDQVKSDLLGVAHDTIESRGAVSEDVAEAMARGVAERFGTDAGLGITGIAGPGGGTDEKPVGTVCYAAHLIGRTVVRRERFNGDRIGVRERAAQATMALLLSIMEGRP